MIELVEFILSNIVTNKEKLSVSEKGGNTAVITILAARMGKS